VITLVVCIAISAGALMASDLTGQQVLSEVGKAGLTLIVGVILGGVLKQALDSHAQTMAERSKRRERLTTMVMNLESTVDSVQNSRLLILAQRTARRPEGSGNTDPAEVDRRPVRTPGWQR